MIVYARICTYMYVYSNMIRIYGHIRTEIVYVRICMYVYVYDVYARTMHVYACIFSYDPLKHGSWCQIPKTHSLWTAASGPHSGHTRASGHAFFSVVGDTFAHPILRAPPPSPENASLAPFAPPLLCRDVPHAISKLGDPVSWPITADLEDMILHCCQKTSADSPPKPLQTAIWLKYEYVRICTYMHLLTHIST